ncbi:cytochrome c oxidase subunit III [Fictibacillus macauensis ZFHKF-1]|uniref:Cytochrome c oxidase subunit III n=1 Tax=Fictibacillus macauensis ZFHKF-1 TaxID=1196324 RepID=I8UDC5_9BACL|nr:cytochrome c oxidase subunit 3 [Fictibacillus macauensis]EIT84925.1 cytochrome c oxidase subunit III [Fictibacillus macauensis ZFHKF-1]
METNQRLTDDHFPENPEKATLDGKNKFLGFWLFLGGETVLFATLFAVYIGLRDNHMDGPSAKELFQLPTVFLATMLLLTSSLTSVYAVLALKQNKVKSMIGWFLVTLLLGLGFLGLEVYEFIEYVHEGHTFTKSAFSSSFYTLVGFHGGHVLFGCLWLVTLLLRNWNRGITLTNAPKYYLFALYWHFVDVVWVFIFTVVYLMGKVG